MQIIEAGAGMVLCDGNEKSGVGGTVYLPDWVENTWIAMTEAEADNLIAKNNPEPEEPDEEISDAEALRIITEGVE